MKMDKSKIGAMLCCGAILLSAATYAISPAFAANTADNVSLDNSASKEERSESGRMARIKIESGEEYVSTVDPEALEGKDEVVISGEVGESFINGDMIIEIVTKDEVERACAD